MWNVTRPRVFHPNLLLLLKVTVWPRLSFSTFIHLFGQNRSEQTLFIHPFTWKKESSLFKKSCCFQVFQTFITWSLNKSSVIVVLFSDSQCQPTELILCSDVCSSLPYISSFSMSFQVMICCDLLLSTMTPGPDLLVVVVSVSSWIWETDRECGEMIYCRAAVMFCPGSWIVLSWETHSIDTSSLRTTDRVTWLMLSLPSDWHS